MPAIRFGLTLALACPGTAVGFVPRTVPVTAYAPRGAQRITERKAGLTAPASASIGFDAGVLFAQHGVHGFADPPATRSYAAAMGAGMRVGTLRSKSVTWWDIH